MKKDFNYCTYTPDFPKNAYMTIAHFHNKALPNDYLYRYPFINLVTSLDEIVRDMTDFSTAARKEKVLIEDICTIVPVTFHDLYPQREEFWGIPTQHYDPQDRIKLLIQAVSQYKMYKLLATAYIDNKIKTVAAAIPFYLSADNSLIERYMLTSDWPVDPKAKYAAFYLFNKPIRFNWKTGKITSLEISRENIIQN